MEKRLDINVLRPNVYKALFEVDKCLSGGPLERQLRDLIRVRASQINKCAYCIEIHVAGALKNGASENRIHALSAWEESPLFSERERSLLAMTEDICFISKKGLKEKTYRRAAPFFTDAELADIILEVGMINLWNRIAVSSHLYHEP